MVTFWTADHADLTLHALAVDTDTGHVAASAGWQEDTSSYFELWPASNGGMITRLGPRSPTNPQMRLSLFGPDLQLQNEIRLSGRSGHFWSTKESTSGRSLFVFSYDARMNPEHPGSSLLDQKILQFQTTDLTQIREWQDNEGFDSATDFAYVRDDRQRGAGYPGSFVLGNLGHAGAIPVYKSSRDMGQPVMLDDDTLVIYGRTVKIIDKAGTVLFTDSPFRRNESAFPVMTAANGKTFAFVVTAYRQPFLEDYLVPTRSRLLVYDAKARRRIGTFPLYGEVNGLSPDGRRIIYIADTILRVYEIAC